MKLLVGRKEPKGCSEADGYWVRGSGLVHVSKDRVNEIPKVIQEYHKMEVELETLRAWSRNGSWVR
jgi:hypothetical protein